VCDFGLVWNTAVIVALVPEDDDFGACNDKLLRGDCGSGAAKAMKDAVDVLEVLPDESADSGILWDGFIVTILRLVASLRSLDSSVIYKRVGNVRDLGG